MIRKIDLQEEINFENLKVTQGSSRKKQGKYYWATAIPTDKHNELINQKIKDKNILEIGCSYGFYAKLYSQNALEYCGIDISNEAIKKAQMLNIKNAEFLCTDAHEIPKNDMEFDFVIVNGLLHHLDLLTALKEIHRVLKNDGYLIFREPLGTNPLFQIYRKFTSEARTKDERPFTFGDIQLMKKFFIFKNIDYIGFTNIFSAFIRIKIIRSLLTKIDFFLGKTFLKIFFWQFAGCIKKRNLII